METSGEAGKIQISSTTKTLLELTHVDGFQFKPRGNIDIKGLGSLETFWLLDRSRSDENAMNFY